MKASVQICDQLRNFVYFLPKGFNVVGTVSTTGEIGQVKLNLIPALIETHGHGADERLHAGSGLVVRGAETAAHILVIQNLDLESEVFLQLYPGEKNRLGHRFK